MPQCSASRAGQSSSIARECDCLAHQFENAADNESGQPRYPTDTTDVEWAAIRQLLPGPGWMPGREGQPEAYCHYGVLWACRLRVIRRRMSSSRI